MNGVYLKLVCVVSMGCGKEISFSESMKKFTLHCNTDITLGGGEGGGGRNVQSSRNTKTKLALRDVCVRW